MTGMLVEGEWKTESRLKDGGGRSKRTQTSFRDRVTDDGSSGFEAEA